MSKERIVRLEEELCINTDITKECLKTKGPELRSLLLQRSNLKDMLLECYRKLFKGMDK